MPSWTNATDLGRTASTKGVLRPTETARAADLRRDHPVDAALAPFVERYWSVRWDRTDLPPFRSEVLTHHAVHLSLEWGDRPRFGTALPAVLVHGAVKRRFVVDLVGRGRVTAAKFRPGGWTAFTGLPPAPNSVVALTAELGLAPHDLLEAVGSHEDDATRAATLDTALAPAATDPDPAYLTLLDVLGQMMHDRAIVRVEQAAADAGLGVRALQRLFATYVGIGPKAVLARYRLHDAVAALDDGAEDLAALAASLGWFDQAHFSRDFRAVVGTTPSAYLASAHGTGRGR